jgi:hypothetical protein
MGSALTHLTTPGINSFTPTRKARGKRLPDCHIPQDQLLLRVCRRAAHEVDVLRPGGVRLRWSDRRR